MNSLNAFKRIMEKYGKTNTLEGTYDDFLTIKKDLEVLEILKKHFQVYFDDETENGLEEKVFNGIDLDDIWGDGYDKDFEKIMEWLEK